MDRAKILVVDDESRMRKLVRDFLVREGYNVLEAKTGWRQWIFSMRKKIFHC